MSSNQESVRQFSIKRRFVLFLGIFAFLAFSLIIHFAVSGVKHGIRYQAELRGEVAGRAELERTIRQYSTEREAIKRDLQEVRRMERTVRKVLGIDSKDGILGQGGGDYNIEEESEEETKRFDDRNATGSGINSHRFHKHLLSHSGYGRKKGHCTGL